MNEQKTKPTRPFSMDYTEAKSKITRAINEALEIHGVPFYLLADIMRDLSRQVEEQAAAEIEKAKREYETKLAEYEREEG